MHSGDLAELEKSDLSEQEKEALLQVMQRAKVSGGPSVLVFVAPRSERTEKGKGFISV